MHAYYPLTWGHIVNIFFVIVVLYVLWLTFRKSKPIAAIVLALYVLIYVCNRLIDQSDNKYSDVSHGPIGSWDVTLFGICLLLAIALQLYVLVIRPRWHHK